MLLINCGTCHMHLGDLDSASEYMNRGLRLFHEMNSVRGEALALGNLGEVQSKRGDHHAALEHYQRCHQLSITHGFKYFELRVLQLIGRSYRELGQFDQARECLGVELPVDKVQVAGQIDVQLQLMLVGLR